MTATIHRDEKNIKRNKEVKEHKKELEKDRVSLSGKPSTEELAKAVKSLAVKVEYVLSRL